VSLCCAASDWIPAYRIHDHLIAGCILLCGVFPARRVVRRGCGAVAQFVPCAGVLVSCECYAWRPYQSFQCAVHPGPLKLARRLPVTGKVEAMTDRTGRSSANHAGLRRPG
jgi:hypothetical protein